MFPENHSHLATVAMDPGQQPQVAAVAMGQVPAYDYQGAELYTNDYHNDQYYLPQEEYMGATISELPLQDL